MLKRNENGKTNRLSYFLCFRLMYFLKTISLTFITLIACVSLENKNRQLSRRSIAISTHKKTANKLLRRVPLD